MEAGRLAVEVAPVVITVPRQALAAGLFGRDDRGLRALGAAIGGGELRRVPARGHVRRDTRQTKAVWGSIVH